MNAKMDLIVVIPMQLAPTPVLDSLVPANQDSLEMDRTVMMWMNVLVATSAVLTLNVLIASGATAALAMQDIGVISFNSWLGAGGYIFCSQ